MSRLRVLIVDDSMIIRAIVERIVEMDSDCQVVGVASDVATARQMIADLRPNVVTLDLAMPGIDGLQYLDEARDLGRSAIVVVSSSTRDGAPATAEALAHGADACFDKAKVMLEAERFIRVLKGAARRKARRNGRRAN